MKTVFFTTVFFAIFILVCQMSVDLTLMSVLFIIGNLLIIYMVYKVLRETFSTVKTFENWYEDQPKQN